MIHPKSLWLLLVTLVAAGGCFDASDHGSVTAPAEAVLQQGNYGPPYVPIPSGFTPVSGPLCARVFRKDYAGGYPDFVAVVDLRFCQVVSLTGQVVTGPPNGSVRLRTNSEFAEAAKARNGGTHADFLVNAAFFAPGYNPTSIAFGLKIDGKVVSYGYEATSRRAGEVLTLSFSPAGTAAYIENYSRTTLDGPRSHVIGMLNASVDKRSASRIPRTFVGIRDGTSDGIAETLLIFVSPGATQREANNVLMAFGAQKTGMMDGGSSTFLRIGGNSYHAGGPVPHAVGVSRRR